VDRHAVDDMARCAHTARQRGANRAAAATVCDMSLLFADPSELYAIADRIARHADAVRSSAMALAVAVANDHWRGVASTAFSAEAGTVLSDMRACAGRLDDAADALRRHAGHVQGALGELARMSHQLERFGESVVHDVGGVLARGEGLLAMVGR
jgi:uncharacterized protein YukE